MEHGDARYDGLYVYASTASSIPSSAALAYHQLWRIEAIFYTAKSILETRPIYHQCDAAIAGFLFCCFFALVLRKEIVERLVAAGTDPEWDDILRDLDFLEEVSVKQACKRFVLRTGTVGCAGTVLKAVGVAPPSLVRQLPQAKPPPTPPLPRKRRGRPRRGATRP